MATREDDIKAVCNAIIEDWWRDGGDHADYCAYCGNDVKSGKIEHDLDCPVLIAKDLMTKGKGEKHGE